MSLTLSTKSVINRVTLQLSKSASIILMDYVMSIGAENLIRQWMNEEAKKKTPSPDFVEKLKIWIQQGKERKDSAFYVDVSGSTLRLPWDEISEKDSAFIIAILGHVFSSKPRLLKQTRKEDFCEMLNVLYPFLRTSNADSFIASVERLAKGEQPNLDSFWKNLPSSG